MKKKASDEDPPKRKKRSGKLRKERTFLHHQCGPTVVKGEDYRKLSDPLDPVGLIVGRRAVCDYCKTEVGLDEVYWEGEEESIAEWRSNKRANAPWMLLITLYFLPFLPAITLGWLAMNQPNKEVPPVVVGIGVMGLALWFLSYGIAWIISWRVWRDFYEY